MKPSGYHPSQRSHSLFAALAALLAMLASPLGHAAVYWVGSSADSECTHSSIQSALAAAATHGGPDTIFVTNELSYAHQQIIIDGQDVSLAGGYNHCNGVFSGSNSSITAAAGHSVIEIRGSGSVYLGHFDLSGANLSVDGGGGINFHGQGSLRLSHVWIHDNTAYAGGGLFVDPTGTSTVELEQSTLVGTNTALNAGGGVLVEGPTTLHLDSTSVIYGNVASGNGYGGGIAAYGPASVVINGTLRLNAAAGAGGGVAAFGGATVYLDRASAAGGALLDSNQTQGVGGGVYLQPGTSGLATLCARNFTIKNNSATGGGAIFASSIIDNGQARSARVYMNTVTGCAYPTGPVACAPGPPCNEISDNISAGAIVQMFRGLLIADRFIARGNQGDHLFRFDTDGMDTSGAALELFDCLLADNIVDSHLLYAVGGSSGGLYVDACTIANNQIAPGATIYSDLGFTNVNYSIVYQPGKQVIDYQGPEGGLLAGFVLANDIASLPGATHNLAGAPLFVDPDNGDYHLLRTSPGVDFAPAVAGTDLDGDPRTLDLVDVPNLYGPTDLGAYEIQTQGADTIFDNGFESSAGHL